MSHGKVCCSRDYVWHLISLRRAEGPRIKRKKKYVLRRSRSQPASLIGSGHVRRNRNIFFFFSFLLGLTLEKKFQNLIPNTPYAVLGNITSVIIISQYADEDHVAAYTATGTTPSLLYSIDLVDFLARLLGLGPRQEPGQSRQCCVTDV